MSYRGGWILPRSFGAHRTSDVHMKSLELAAAQAARDAALAAPAQPRIQEFAILQNISLEQAPQEGSSTHRHEETQAERDMWAGWDRSNDPLEIGESLDEITQRKRQLFEKKLDEYGIWEGDEELITNLDDPIGALEQAWDETEQDELLSEVLEGLGAPLMIRILVPKLMTLYQPLNKRKLR